MSGLTNTILDLMLWAPGALLALSFHEYSHGRVAYALGDPTAQRAGRLTLNPLAHLDPIGTIAIFIVHIGWAKPVPVNPNNFSNPRKDMVLVSLAGPASNLLLALIAGVLLKGLTFAGLKLSTPWMMVLYTMDINIILMVFNLIPLPPLDGSKILFGLVKMKSTTVFKLERFGPIIILGLIFIGMFTGLSFLWIFIGPPVTLFRLLFA